MREAVMQQDVVTDVAERRVVEIICADYRMIVVSVPVR